MSYFLAKKSNCLYYDWKSTKFTKQMPLGWVVTRKVGKVLLAFGKVGDFFFGKVANASLCIVDCKRNIQHVIDGIVLFAFFVKINFTNFWHFLQLCVFGAL